MGESGAGQFLSEVAGCDDNHAPLWSKHGSRQRPVDCPASENYVKGTGCPTYVFHNRDVYQVGATQPRGFGPFGSRLNCDNFTAGFPKKARKRAAFRADFEYAAADKVPDRAQKDGPMPAEMVIRGPILHRAFEFARVDGPVLHRGQNSVDSFDFCFCGGIHTYICLRYSCTN